MSSHLIANFSVDYTELKWRWLGNQCDRPRWI